MEYQLTFTEIDGVLQVDIFGERLKDNLVDRSKNAWREIARVTREKNLDKLLVLSNATGSYPTLDAYRINSTLDECNVDRRWKIAFVNLDQPSFQQVKFAETVAVNRGFNIGVFNDPDEARAWLLET